MPSGIIIDYYLGDQHEVIVNTPYDPVYFSVTKFQAPSSYGMWVKWKGSEGAFNFVRVKLEELRNAILALLGNHRLDSINSIQVPKMSRL